MGPSAWQCDCIPVFSPAGSVLPVAVRREGGWMLRRHQRGHGTRHPVCPAIAGRLRDLDGTAAHPPGLQEDVRSGRRLLRGTGKTGEKLLVPQSRQIGAWNLRFHVVC